MDIPAFATQSFKSILSTTKNQDVLTGQLDNLWAAVQSSTLAPGSLLAYSINKYTVSIFSVCATASITLPSVWTGVQ